MTTLLLLSIFPAFSSATLLVEHPLTQTEAEIALLHYSLIQISVPEIDRQFAMYIFDPEGTGSRITKYLRHRIFHTLTATRVLICFESSLIAEPQAEKRAHAPRPAVSIDITIFV